VADPERRLAVLGSPIAHSKSPALHAAAYRALGLPWEYEAVEVPSGGLGGFLDSLDESWRGLSLTMPLKREVLPLLDGADALVGVVGAANTVLLDGGRRRGFNTDVHGVEEALREAGVARPARVLLLGAGSTAAAVVAAVVRMGAVSVAVSTRSPEKAAQLTALAERLGIELVVGGFDLDVRDPDVVISTLPGGTVLNRELPEELRAAVPLLDVAYDPWPSALARSWQAVGGRVHSGLGMLVHQALMQVRVFVNRDPNLPLPDEHGVLSAMRSAIGFDGAPIVGG
jgi:shikimate dehydrogenase